MKRAITEVGYAIGLALLLTANVSFSNDNIEVMASEGSVVVGDALGKTKKTVQAKSIVSAGYVLSTGPNARAVVRVGAEGILVVGKNSQVEIGQIKNDQIKIDKTKKNVSFIRQITGVIYYAINSVKGTRRTVEVRTATATIGIRGTRFLVTDVEGRNELGMRKGEVSVASPEGEFEIHKQAVQDEYEAFKASGEAEVAKGAQEFEDYKANVQKEFVEYTKEFTLAQDRMVSFDGKRVDERPLSGETQKDMEDFESYADKWISEIRD